MKPCGTPETEVQLKCVGLIKQTPTIYIASIWSQSTDSRVCVLWLLMAEVVEAAGRQHCSKMYMVISQFL